MLPLICREAGTGIQHCTILPYIVTYKRWLLRCSLKSPWRFDRILQSHLTVMVVTWNQDKAIPLYGPDCWNTIQESICFPITRKPLYSVFKESFSEILIHCFSVSWHTVQVEPIEWLTSLPNCYLFFPLLPGVSRSAPLGETSNPSLLFWVWGCEQINPPGETFKLFLSVTYLITCCCWYLMFDRVAV